MQLSSSFERLLSCFEVVGKRSMDEMVCTIEETTEKTYFDFPYKCQRMSLDIGCGDAPRGTVNCDVRRTRIKARAKNFIVCDANILPFRPNIFNEIVSNHVIEHLKDPEKVLSEINRVLKLGGLFVVATPNKYDLIDSYLKDPGHLHHFSSTGFKRLLRKHFREVSLIGTGELWILPAYRFQYWLISHSWVLRYIARRIGFSHPILCRHLFAKCKALAACAQEPAS